MKFPKALRLLSRGSFQKVYNLGKRCVGTRLSIYYAFGEQQAPRLGITISKKWGKAHDRNRFKRVVREGFRLSLDKLPPSLEINVHPREGYRTLSPSDVMRELSLLLETLEGAHA